MKLVLTTLALVMCSILATSQNLDHFQIFNDSNEKNGQIELGLDTEVLKKLINESPNEMKMTLPLPNKKYI